MMKIKNHKDQTTWYTNLKYKDTFMYDGELYVKLADNQSFNFNRCETMPLHDFLDVIPVDIDVCIKRCMY